MVRIVIGVILALALSSAASAQGRVRDMAAQARLTQCFDAHSSQEERDTVIRWAYAVLSASPKLAGLSSVTDAQRSALSRQAGAYLSRLVTRDCRTEAIAALRRNGPSAIQQSFLKLGTSSVTSLMKDPMVAIALAQLLNGVDMIAFGAVLMEGATP